MMVAIGNAHEVDRRMTEAEAAAYLGFERQTLATWRSARKGPPFMKLAGKAIRYSQRALDVWMAANTVVCGSEAATPA